MSFKKNNKDAAKKIFIKPEKPKDTYQVCKKFGCGKRLKDYESLFSDYCFSHAQKK